MHRHPACTARLAVLLAVIGSTLACGEPEPEASTLAFESTLESDLEELARDSSELAADAADEALEDGCFRALGGCQTCFTTDGGTLDGTFELGIDETPCSVTIGRRSTWTYTVESSAFSGSWATSLEGVTVEMTGERTASVVRESDTDSATWSSAMDLTDLSLSAELDGTVTGFSAALAYSGFGGSVVDVTVSGDAASISGEAVMTGPDGAITCAIAGTLDTPEVSCAEDEG